MVKQFLTNLCEDFVGYMMFAFFLVAIFTVFIFNSQSLGLPDVWSYHIPFHVLNYFDFGFVARGLVGTILLPFKPYMYNLTFFTLIVFLFLALVFAGLVTYFIFSRKMPMAFRHLFLYSPCSFIHFGFDSPRTTEFFWLSLYVFALIVIQLNLDFWLKLLVVSVLCSIALLTYEGVLFFMIPSVCIALLSSQPSSSLKIQIRKILLFLILPSLIAISLHFFGQYEYSYAALSSTLERIAPGYNAGILSEVLQRGLVNTHFSLDYGSRYTWFCNSALLLVYLSIWLITASRIIYRIRGPVCAFVFASSFFTSLFICIVALDYARYCAVAFVVSALLFVELVGGEKNILLVPRVWSFMPLFFLLGPVGVAAINPFPLMKLIAGGNIYLLF
jgi:hypothetical protein